MDLFVRCVKAYGSDDSEYKLRPSFARIVDKSFCGMVSSLDLDSLKVSNWCMNYFGPKFLMLYCDNHPVNRMAARHVVDKYASENSLFVCVIICLSHTLHNAAKWGNLVFPLGEYLRISHFFEV